MATAAVTVPTTQAQAQVPQLCDYCHQKPKFSNHLYCSKTCAGQAATLCNQCHKKPKFQNFEYCGKNCAALANANGTAAKPRSANAAGVAQPKGAKQQQPAPAFDPIQLAKLVAQHIPQVQALLNPQTNNNTAQVPQPGIMNPSYPVSQVQTQVIPPHLNVNNPFLDPTMQAQLQMQNAAQNQDQGPAANGAVFNLAPSIPLAGAQPQFHIMTSSANSTGDQQASDDTECLIPGCGKPVHFNAKGMKASDYCSMRCREEAVVSGLRPACIMCLTMPQGETDYFCSKDCREVSMSKSYEVETE